MKNSVNQLAFHCSISPCRCWWWSKTYDPPRPTPVRVRLSAANAQQPRPRLRDGQRLLQCNPTAGAGGGFRRSCHQDVGPPTTPTGRSKAPPPGLACQHCRLDDVRLLPPVLLAWSCIMHGSVQRFHSNRKRGPGHQTRMARLLPTLFKGLLHGVFIHSDDHIRSRFLCKLHKVVVLMD
jgi:hypothetical protein